MKDFRLIDQIIYLYINPSDVWNDRVTLIKTFSKIGSLTHMIYYCKIYSITQ